MENKDNNLTFINITMRNILSFGNQEQVVQLNRDLISVILGENLDSGGEDSRNACGKSAIIDALCYALFGKTLRDLPNQGLINDLAARGHAMSVKVEFDKGKYSYLVERGEKPSKLLLLRKPRGSKEDFYARESRRLKFDRSQSSKADTTKEITTLLGYTLPLFSYLVANSSESTPFFKLREDQRREVGESLFGFTILSERAERLKKKRKTEKDNLIKEETRFSTTVAANDRVRREIKDMEQRSQSWERRHDSTVSELEGTIGALKEVDIDQEIETLNALDDLRKEMDKMESRLSELQHKYTSHEKDSVRAKKDIESCEATIVDAEGKIKELDESRCPTCHQHWEPDPTYRGGIEETLTKGPEIIAEKTQEIEEHTGAMEGMEGEYGELETSMEQQQEALKSLKEIQLTFGSSEDAAESRATLKVLEENLVKEQSTENPHEESIKGMRESAIGEEDPSNVNRLKKLINHFNFMIELLTNKDSYVRKHIIDQWLPKLNEHIAEYLDVLELDYRVEFQPDLTASILKFEREKAWGNLSKGERARVVIALNFAFQDMFEFMNYRINLLCVDELLDNGMCSRGAERAVDLIKVLGTEKHKRVLLITHRDDIAARVDHMMIVRRENDLSKIVEAE